MADDDDHVNDGVLVVKLSEVLLSSECQRLNFRWGRQHITGHGFHTIVLALADSRINLFEADDAAHKLDDDVEASLLRADRDDDHPAQPRSSAPLQPKNDCARGDPRH